MSLFDKMESDREMNDIIRNAELLNIPFKIESMNLLVDRPDKFSPNGKKTSMRCTIIIEETGEKFTYFGQNGVVFNKLNWLLSDVPDFKEYVFKLIKTKSANGNEYFDLVEVKAKKDPQTQLPDAPAIPTIH